MKALADALVYSVTYINCSPEPVEAHLDEDVHALENVGAFLRTTTPEEQDALAVAAQRAFEAERAGPRREEYLSVLGSWMENMFAEGWEGNRRI